MPSQISKTDFAITPEFEKWAARAISITVEASVGRRSVQQLRGLISAELAARLRLRNQLISTKPSRMIPELLKMNLYPIHSRAIEISATFRNERIVFPVASRFEQSSEGKWIIQSCEVGPN